MDTTSGTSTGSRTPTSTRTGTETAPDTAGLHGVRHLPGEATYERARTGYQRAHAHRPEFVLAAADADDVRAAIEHAAAHGTSVTTQIGGHGLAAALEGGVLVDLSALRTVEIDPAARTARVGGGATWQDVLDAAAPHGLAPLSGSSPHVGAVPYTLGGGFGLLGRRHGYAADHVRAFDLATGDGRTRRAEPAASDELDRELFWALRGGGAGGGIVTAMEIDLVEAGEVYGGCLYADLDAVPDALDRWRRWTSTVPDDVTSGVAMLVFPDVAGVPEELRGRHVVQVQVCVADPDGEHHVAALRETLPAVRDTMARWALRDSGAMFEEPERPHAYRSRAVTVRELDPRALARLTKAAGPAAPAMCVVGLRHLGGAFARRPRHPSTVAHRDAGYLLSVLSPVRPTSEATEAEVRALHAELLAPFEEEVLGTCLPFSFGPATAEEVRGAFTSADAARLTRVRAAVDPDAVVLPNHPLSPE